MHFQIYREKFVAVCSKIFEFGIKEHERRAKEVEDFRNCIDEAKDDNRSSASKLIDSFEDYRKNVKKGFEI